MNFADQPDDMPPEQRAWKVSFIAPTAQAAKSGLRIGDIVLTVDGQPISGYDVHQGYTLMNAPPGTKLAFGLARGETVTVIVGPP